MDIYGAGLIAGILGFVFGGLWYGVFFHKVWLAGLRTLGRKSGPQPMALLPVLLLNLVGGVGVATLYSLTSLTEHAVWGGLGLGLMVWVLAMTALQTQVIYLHLPRQISLPTAGYWLGTFLIYGAVAGLWPR